MDSKRFLVLVSFSLVFILLFCNDTIEGQTERNELTPEELEELFTSLGEREPIRCENEEPGIFEPLKECLNSPESVVDREECDIDISDECARDCMMPIYVRNDITGWDSLEDDDIEEKSRVALDEFITKCSPSGSEPEQRFGVDCLENCDEYFHECEVRRERQNVNGRRKTVTTYGNVGGCPHGEIPDQTCDDHEWGCKQCKPGYYAGIDNLCKPNPSAWKIILFVILALIIGGILFFISLLIKEWIMRREGQAYATGAKKAGIFPTAK